MDPITITLTGHLARDPHVFATTRGPAVDLWVAVPLPAAHDPEGITRYFQVVAFGNLAENVAATLHKHDRVTVRGRDIQDRSWAGEDGRPHACIKVIAWDIAPSLLRETALLSSAARRAARLAAIDGHDGDLPAAEHADLQVLAGVTAQPVSA